MAAIRYRQVHLDFHTSEYIDHIGGSFDPADFAGTLAASDVDSITCFARCHHGWLYYPSKAHPELIHPQLSVRDLLPQQIAACHARGIRVPIYTTVQWDGRIMREHPEWLAVDGNGNYVDTQHVPAPHFYHTICLNSPYRAFFKTHLQDIIDVIGKDQIDGFFMDILFQVECNCPHCRQKMTGLGMDPDQKNQRYRYAALMLDEFKTEITVFIRSQLPEAGIFYNSSHVGPKSKASFKDYSHLELESLPSGGWGYDHFPVTSRYARTLGKEMIGMTGKFHTYWGDFHSLKNQAALEFECFQMLALGAGCSIGDQLHPNGRLSPGAYDLIGKVYASVKAKEAYCRDAVPVSPIAILTPEEYYPDEPHNLGLPPSLVGAARMLQELSWPFDIIDSQMDFSAYSLLVLPDQIPFSPELSGKIQAYLDQGGSLLGSYDACLDKGPASELYGVRYLGESPYYREFVLPNAMIGKSLHREEYVMYDRAFDVEPVPGAHSSVLMDKVKPYFDRSGDRFCSHQHAPSSGQTGHPAVIRNGNAIYFAHPVFRLYRKNAPRWCKLMVRDALELLLGLSPVSHNGPSTLITALNEQPRDNRLVLHLLHYITEKRSEEIYTIEDVIPLNQLEMRIEVGPRQVRRVQAVPAATAISFRQEDGAVYFTVDQVLGHGMVALDYERS